jgi:hypothetical protein
MKRSLHAVGLAALLVALLGATLIAGSAADAADTSTHGGKTATILPSKKSVAIDGAFTKTVSLDAGVFSLTPVTRSSRPRLSRSAAAKKIWASPTFQSAQAGPLGYGMVTITLHPHGVPRIHHLLAWVGFAHDTAAFSCPAERTTAAKPPDLPSGGYQAVVLGSTGTPAVAYSARSFECGHLSAASLTAASEALSVPWDQVGGLDNGNINLSATVPPCGTVAGVSSGGSKSSITITVDVTVPDVATRCGGATQASESVMVDPSVSDPGAPPPLVTIATKVLHGKVGPADFGRNTQATQAPGGVDH